MMKLSRQHTQVSYNLLIFVVYSNTERLFFVIILYTVPTSNNLKTLLKSLLLIPGMACGRLGIRSHYRASEDGGGPRRRGEDEPGDPGQSGCSQVGLHSLDLQRHLLHRHTVYCRDTHRAILLP